VREGWNLDATRAAAKALTPRGLQPHLETAPLARAVVLRGGVQQPEELVMEKEYTVRPRLNHFRKCFRENKTTGI
jgi:hypothetical protein